MNAVELCGGTHFLLLHRLPNGDGHAVETFARFGDVIPKMREGSRVSPIFSINKSPVPKIPTKKQIWILFFGPVFPGKLQTEKLPKIYLSLGLLNIVCFCETAAQLEKATRYAEGLNVYWEAWPIKNGKLNGPHSRRVLASQIALPKFLSNPLPENSKHMRSAEREYQLLMNSSYAFAAKYIPDYAKELEDFDKILRDTLSDSGIERGFKHGMLVNTNAYLSRQSEQTYAGTPPIIENDSHHWTHSLLGVGIGSLAILRMRQFISRAFVKSELIAKITSLKEKDPLPIPLHQVDYNNPFWRLDQLAPLAGLSPSMVASKPKTPDSSEEPVIPHITCFSGRDGFKSTEVSLSVPQDLLTSCNTSTWTLLTITHEISHILVAGILGAILPATNDLAGIREVVRNLANEKAVKNLLQQVKCLLARAIWQMDVEFEQRNLTEELYASLIRKHYREINEILTHGFDFLYFYRKDAKHYIGSVWTSWEIIPNISERIPDYIVRSLCALHTGNLNRKDGLNTTTIQLLKHLEDLSKNTANAKYILEACSILKSEQKKYRDLLANREIFVRIVRHFLYSGHVDKILTSEGLLGSGSNDGYPVAPSNFGNDQIQNPLRFVEHFCRDEEPDTAKSVWILQHLAFGKNDCKAESAPGRDG